MVSQPVTPESSLTTMTAASVMASDLACGMAKLHHARGALGLAGQEGVHHGVGVVSETGLDGLVGDKAQGLVTRSEVLGDKNVLDLHEVGSLGLGGLDGSGLGSLDRLSGSGLLVLLEVILFESDEQDATDHGADEDREDPLRAVLDNGQDQEAAVRRRIVNVEENGQDGSDGRAEHHDGHDGPDVLGHERNGALGDVGATKDEVDDTGVMILLAEVLLATMTAKVVISGGTMQAAETAAMKLVPKL